MKCQDKVKIILLSVLLSASLTAEARDKLTSTEKLMAQQGMVDIHDYDNTVKVSLMYGRSDNFTGQILYTDIHHAYLHPKAAKALARAQQFLKQLRPDLSLIVFDACRPMNVQQKMWNVVAGTPKYIYVSNPAHGGGLHNYGMAVDVSICDAEGDTVTMGTKIDYMGAEAHIDRELQLVKDGKLRRRAVLNRQLLRHVMRKAGFKALRTEWWHFNYISRAVAKRYYKYVK